MGYTIIRETEGAAFAGCDFVVRLSADRKNTPVKILQLTDLQAIDSSQRRTPDRLWPEAAALWSPENFDRVCGGCIRAAVAATRPDLIIITGDIVHGAFDDDGSMLIRICRLMDSFGIPWAPVFGNHDNESKKGVAWQCARLRESPHCLFARGGVSGNGNYTVGIAVEDTLIRVLHMVDSNGCKKAEDPAVIREPGIYPDQLRLIEANTAAITRAQHRDIPAFMACHFPISAFREAETAKGYLTAAREEYGIGDDVPALDGDFGARREGYDPIEIGDGCIDFLHAQHIDGVFVGHAHYNCTCIGYENIKWVFGLKTGEYDYFFPEQVGGVLITLEGGGFSVSHVPTPPHRDEKS